MTVSTEFITSARILIPLGITLVAPFFIWFFRENINRREAVSIWAGILTFLSVASMVPDVLEVSFAADGLAFIFALIASFLWVFATSYNIGYMRTLNEHAQTRYYFCFAVAIF
ncbi:monovalent cation/H+ antiporter subunit D family protein, partial [Aduncisulcus paluster]